MFLTLVTHSSCRVNELPTNIKKVRVLPETAFFIDLTIVKNTTRFLTNFELG